MSSTYIIFRDVSLCAGGEPHPARFGKLICDQDEVINRTGEKLPFANVEDSPSFLPSTLPSQGGLGCPMPSSTGLMRSDLW